LNRLRFGVATADHQCEAYDGHDDIRDVWERVRGLVARGKATDFWNRYREDIELARGLGCTIFRFSLSWARLEPEPGVWNDEAFAHYRDVLQAMHDAGLAPMVTLVHNTWPLHVQAAGKGAGLLDRGFPDRVARFAEEVARRLGDLIGDYVTLNEPDQLVYGWIKGFWMRAYAMPPGQPPYASSDAQMDDVLTVIPNLFRAHARAREAIRRVHPGARVGTNPLVLGLPRWLQGLIDRNATHLQSPEAAKRKAARFASSPIDEGGRVDCSIAQLTLTLERGEHAFFSEPYYRTRLALLHTAASPPTDSLETWRGRVAVVAQTLAASDVGGWLPAATVTYASSLSEAVDAVRSGAADAVFDDEVTLQPYADNTLTLFVIPNSDQYFAVAMALGSRTLLNIADRAIRDLRGKHPEIPSAFNRKTIANYGRDDGTDEGEDTVPSMDRAIERIRKRGKLRVGIHPGTPGLCVAKEKGYVGLEPEIARRIAQRIFGDSKRVEFVPLRGEQRLSATHSWLHALFALRKGFAIFSTLLGTNWWNLGLAGKLPEFLCPRECVGALDYVGLDYYWGVPSFWPQELQRLSAASDFEYSNAPVWPDALDLIIREAERDFPGKPIIVIENGCVTRVPGFSRADYLTAHVNQIRKAIERGAPVEAYICWSITSNREWGLHFNDGSDFGLYHVDLDTDPDLKRVPTDSSRAYRDLIASFEEAPSP
jgi:beta-glucosidase/6-phospho-beta-glucosidase/beta-galactosidase/ABC-type amino acid transport substrate-binding protein